MKSIKWTGHLPETTEQMTLRDYFAGQAFPRFVELAIKRQEQYPPHAVAHDCYVYADAMLAERKKGGAL